MFAPGPANQSTLAVSGSEMILSVAASRIVTKTIRYRTIVKELSWTLVGGDLMVSRSTMRLVMLPNPIHPDQLRRDAHANPSAYLNPTNHKSLLASLPS